MRTESDFSRGIADAINEQYAYANRFPVDDADERKRLAIERIQRECRVLDCKGMTYEQAKHAAAQNLRFIALPRSRPNPRQRFFRRLRRWSYSLGLALAFVIYTVFVYCLGWWSIGHLYK